MDYPVDLNSNVDPIHRWNNIHTKAPPAKINGGLYCGPKNNAPWMPKDVVPTTTYFMQVLLKNVDPPPPPGATEQYPTNNRLGNNYTAMPGVKWLNTDKTGPYHIKVIDTNLNKKKI